MSDFSGWVADCSGWVADFSSRAADFSGWVAIVVVFKDSGPDLRGFPRLPVDDGKVKWQVVK
ncbi:hypothetical protein BT67DRAFT_438987 [Trichocladium antarcticum]|uniref:Uncharacterized protein n=1 Tax=Trichocladium antarcticum TaxID=1450529 RepID=A0AAN6URP9_9PEZI|nr:hypothetical protein BT67DRAFT_438985 [Trichocladium antarcticum]KAK4137744.1 hypothetical protein BT67DRAFT_438987 [Trichocladium antarcticum]